MFLLILGTASLETVGVASIMPFVSVLATPNAVVTNPYLASAYDHLGFVAPQAFLFFLGAVVLGLFVSALFFKGLTNYAISRFSYMRLHSISCRLLGAYLRQPYEFFLGRNTADLGKGVLSEVEHVAGYVILPFLRMLSGAVVATAILLLLLAVEPRLSLVVGAVLGGAYTGIYLIARRLLQRIGKDRVRANQQRFVLAHEALNGIKDLRLLGREGAYLRRFRGPSERFARHQATSQVIATVPQFGIQAVAFGGVLAVVLYLLGRYGGLEGALPLIAMYAFAGYRLMPAFQEVFKNLTQLRFSGPALDTLCSDLMHKEGNALYVSDEEGKARSRLIHDIRLEEVTYRYPGSERLALDSLSLEIRAGTRVAFVGHTGAGKSTAVDLILGLLKPTDGRILVDGVLLEGAHMCTWQRNIGYVPQSVYLADDTVTANIAFGVGKEEIDHEAVEQAARIAQVHEFIIGQLPQGYDSVVGERGVRLSGGQRQRLTIARALYHDPDVIVFDEATSALDTVTERAVMEAIEALRGHKTVILIAHRVSTVCNCDCIFVLQDGCLAARGTFGELSKLGLESVSPAMVSVGTG